MKRNYQNSRRSNHSTHLSPQQTNPSTLSHARAQPNNNMNNNNNNNTSSSPSASPSPAQQQQQPSSLPAPLIHPYHQQQHQRQQQQHQQQQQQQQQQTTALPSFSSLPKQSSSLLHPISTTSRSSPSPSPSPTLPSISTAAGGRPFYHHHHYHHHHLPTPLPVPFPAHPLPSHLNHIRNGNNNNNNGNANNELPPLYRNQEQQQQRHLPSPSQLSQLVNTNKSPPSTANNNNDTKNLITLMPPITSIPSPSVSPPPRVVPFHHQQQPVHPRPLPPRPPMLVGPRAPSVIQTIPEFQRSIACTPTNNPVVPVNVPSPSFIQPNNNNNSNNDNSNACNRLPVLQPRFRETDHDQRPRPVFTASHDRSIRHEEEAKQKNDGSKEENKAFHQTLLHAAHHGTLEVEGSNSNSNMKKVGEKGVQHDEQRDMKEKGELEQAQHDKKKKNDELGRNLNNAIENDAIGVIHTQARTNQHVNIWNNASNNVTHQATDTMNDLYYQQHQQPSSLSAIHQHPVSHHHLHRSNSPVPRPHPVEISSSSQPPVSLSIPTGALRSQDSRVEMKPASVRNNNNSSNNNNGDDDDDAGKRDVIPTNITRESGVIVPVVDNEDDDVSVRSDGNSSNKMAVKAPHANKVELETKVQSKKEIHVVKVEEKGNENENQIVMTERERDAEKTQDVVMQEQSSNRNDGEHSDMSQQRQRQHTPSSQHQEQPMPQPPPTRPTTTSQQQQQEQQLQPSNTTVQAGTAQKHLKVEDALAYLEKVKRQFSEQQNVYNQFLDVMKEFKAQDIDTSEVIKRVSELFKGHKDLILGFNTFLPPGYKIQVTENEATGALNAGFVGPHGKFSELPTYRSKAITSTTNTNFNVNNVRVSSSSSQGNNNNNNSNNNSNNNNNNNNNINNNINDNINNNSNINNNNINNNNINNINNNINNNISNSNSNNNNNSGVKRSSTGIMEPGVSDKGGINNNNNINSNTNNMVAPSTAGRVFTGSDGGGGGGDTDGNSTKLIKQKGVFLTPGKNIARKNGQSSGQQQQQSKDDRQQNEQDGINGRSSGMKNLLSCSNVKNNGMEGNEQVVTKSVEFDHAISFMTNIKDRFCEDPETFSEFLTAMKHFRDEQKSIREVFDKVAELFGPHKDLLIQFKEFIPLASAAAMASMNQQQQQRRRRSVIDGSPYRMSIFKRRAKFFDKMKNQLGPSKSHLYTEFMKCLSLLSSGIVSQEELISLTSEILRDCQDAQRSFLSYMQSMGRDYDDEGIDDIVDNDDGEGDGEGDDMIVDGDDDDDDGGTQGQGHGQQNGGLDESSSSSSSEKDETPVDEEKLRYYRTKAMSEIAAECGHDAIVSYRRMPKDFPKLTYTGRSTQERRILNDTYVNVTTGSEDFAFVRKNIFEDNLFRAEDDRYELDMVISTNQATIQRLEVVISTMSKLPANEKKRHALASGVLSAIHFNSIRRIYGKYGDEIIAQVRMNPSITIPIVIVRLKQKDVEWRKVRNEMNKFWREVGEKNFHKSLDHRFGFFKGMDKKNLNMKNLIMDIMDPTNSILTRDMEMTRARNYAIPKGAGGAFDRSGATKAVWEAACMCQESGPRCLRLKFNCCWIHKIVVDLITWVVHEDSGSSADAKRGVTEFTKLIQGVFDVDSNTGERKISSSDIEVLFGDESIYVMFRLYHILYERLLTGLELANEQVRDRERREELNQRGNSNSIPTESIVKPRMMKFVSIDSNISNNGNNISNNNNNSNSNNNNNNINHNINHNNNNGNNGNNINTSSSTTKDIINNNGNNNKSDYGFSLGPEFGNGKQVFEKFIQDLVKPFIRGKLEYSKYEDRCRVLLGTGAYCVFTLDKVVQRLTKQIVGVFISDKVSKQFLSLFECSRRRKHISGIEEMYSIAASRTMVEKRTSGTHLMRFVREYCKTKEQVVEIGDIRLRGGLVENDKNKKDLGCVFVIEVLGETGDEDHLKRMDVEQQRIDDYLGFCASYGDCNVHNNININSIINNINNSINNNNNNINNNINDNNNINNNNNNNNNNHNHINHININSININNNNSNNNNDINNEAINSNNNGNGGGGYEPHHGHHHDDRKRRKAGGGSEHIGEISSSMKRRRKRFDEELKKWKPKVKSEMMRRASDAVVDNGLRCKMDSAGVVRYTAGTMDFMSIGRSKKRKNAKWSTVVSSEDWSKLKMEINRKHPGVRKFRKVVLKRLDEMEMKGSGGGELEDDSKVKTKSVGSNGNGKGSNGGNTGNSHGKSKSKSGSGSGGGLGRGANDAEMKD